MRRSRHAAARRRKRRPPDVSPQLEALEPRLLLSTTYTVTDLGDAVVADEFLTLREAVLAANVDPDADTIEFATGAGTLNLTGGYLEITQDLTVTGPGADRVVVNNTDDLGSVFRITSGTVTIENLTVTGGSDSGIYNQAGDLTLSGVTLSGNSAGFFGGGLQNWGTATITNSTISGNTSAGFGGGIANFGTMTGVNVTVTANRADDDDNGSGDGGGIYTAGAAALHNTLNAGNFLGSSSTPDDAAGTFGAASSYNLTGTIDGSFGLDGTGSQYGSASGAGVLDAMLGALADNGGATHTHALQPGSPAFDSGDNARAAAAGLTTDQRGAGYDRVLYAIVDIGAVENVRLGSIGDVVWDDKDADGVQDPSETGIADVTVWLRADDGGAPGAIVDTQVTAADGAYRFIDVSAGSYWVDVDESSVALTDCLPTTDNDPLDLALGVSENYLTADFGYSADLIIVTTLTDELDVVYEDGDGLSLREALARAAGLAGEDTVVIQFADGLTGTMTLTIGELTIDSDVDIRGPGSGLLTIDGQGVTRLFDIGNAASAAISDLRLARGQSGSAGGAIYLDTGVTLAVDGVVFFDNNGNGAGAIHSQGATLTVTDCQFTNGDSQTSAGAIWSAAGVLTVTDSTFTGNNGPYGGAIGCDGGTLTAVNVSITHNNSIHRGGGIYAGAGANVTITDSTISNNTGGPCGGGLNVTNATVTIDRCTIANNQAIAGAGVRAVTDATVYILNSLITGNTGAGWGGGLYNIDDAVAVVVNSTFSDNDATETGGAIYQSQGTMTLINTTVTDNTADVDGDGGDGGGIYNAYGTVTLHNTIVTGNRRTAAPDDVWGAFDPTSSHNFIGVGDGSDISGTPDGNNPNGNFVGTGAAPIDPMLGPLGDNGGPTQTYALLIGSPAINAGSNDRAEDAGMDPVNPAETDQRGAGFARFMDTAVDIGAVEAQWVSGTIGDTIWDDLDYDGIQDGGETGIDSVTVRLYTSDGDGDFEPGTDDVLVAEVLTAGGGAYDFERLEPRDYWVDADGESAPVADYVGTTQNDPLLVALGPGVDYDAADFGFFANSSIAGSVWKDANEDAAVGATEAGFAGVTVHLYADAGLSDLVGTQISDANGEYSFVDLLPGDYWLQADETLAPLDTAALTTAANPLPVTLGEDTDLAAAGFGYSDPIVVDTLDDVVDGGDGLTSLREALTEAATRPLDDAIVFDPGLPYNPALPAGKLMIDSGLGQFNINSNVLIQGPGSELLTIDAAAACRIFYVASGADVTASINGLKAFRGYDAAGGQYGAGIYIGPDNTLSMTDVIFEGGTGDFGGVRNYGTLTMTDCVVHANYGGISSEGVLVVDNSSITDNASFGNHGIGSSGTLVLRNSIVSGNSNTNIDTHGGGIIIYTGDATIIDSTVSGNKQQGGQGSGAGIRTREGTTLMMSGSTVSGNQAWGYAGGLSISGSAYISNSTISGNKALYSSTGGIYVHGPGVVAIVGSTISGNTAATMRAGIYSQGHVTLYNTIVAGNTSPGNADDVSAGAGGVFESASANNLIGIGDASVTIVDGVNGNQVGTAGDPIDPMLGSRADNGGPTLTHALLSGSPAINAGDNSLAKDAENQPEDTDQRGSGYDRIVDGTVDIGAVEAQWLSGSIGDFVWDDANWDGVQDAGEPGIDGVTVTLYADDGDATFEPGGDDTLIDTRITAAGGAYDFPNLPADDYWVDFDEESAPVTDHIVTGGTNSLAVALAPGQDYDDADLGFSVVGSIGDTVFNDTDSDGLQGADEGGVDGVTVQLYLDDGDGTPELGRKQASRGACAGG